MAKKIPKADAPRIGSTLSGSDDYLKNVQKALSASLSSYVLPVDIGTFKLSGNLLRRASLSGPEVQKLKQDILDLQANVSKQASELKMAAADKAEQTTQLSQLTATLEELHKKQELNVLLSRVSPQAEKAILDDSALKDQFFAEKEQLAFVLSIDIRRSTDLMLKARSPVLFAEFMTRLCEELERLVKEEHGVFDKFTGDGILAFFPEFFSGKDAGYHAISVAQKSLAIFEKCYRENRPSFSTILSDVNLAIGIDFGNVNLVQVADGLTVVGVPVVYACRLSGGPSGSILLNQPAYEQISGLYGSLCLLSETKVEIRNEGEVVCYDLKPSNKKFTPTPPPWIESQSAPTSPSGADNRPGEPLAKS